MTRLIHKLADNGEKSSQIIFAQFNELITKIPLLYCILLVNSCFLAYTFYGVAPNYLTIHVTVILSIGCVARVYRWYGFRNSNFSLKEATQQIQITIFFSVLISIGLSAWSYTLYGYGDLAHKTHVVYYVSITVIGIIVCLIHLPMAAWSASITAGLPFVAFFVNSEQPVFVAMASNFTLVVIVLMIITHSYNRVFSSVINAKQQLEQQHRHTQKLNKQNELLANQDGLTKLANRRSFAKFLNNKLSVNSHQDAFIVGLIDLDGFKPVNEIHGHSAGDRVLTEVSIRLKNILYEKSMLARIGGDEFAIVVDFTGDQNEIQTLGKTITECLQIPFKMRAGLIQISGSCGFALSEPGNTAEELMDHADFALSEAKNCARGSSVIFVEEHEKQIRKKSQIELALGQSIPKGQITNNYQPIVDAKTGEIVGFESLARWFHPQLGHIPPEQFIITAEKMGMITEITIYLFEQALVNLKDWPEHIYLSFNLSAHDVINRNTLDKLREILSKHQISSNRIQFEITETTMMTDLEHCSSITQELQQQGFLIALDDFGSGYSSLSYIHKLAFNKLKIDRSFVQNIQMNSRSRGVVKTILELCSSFEVCNTVEGVETEEQKNILLTLGCRYMQGYYFYKPAPAEYFQPMFAKKSVQFNYRENTLVNISRQPQLN